MGAGDTASRLRALYDGRVSPASPSAGVTIAEINLKLIWDVISAIRVGETGQAFVLDRSASWSRIPTSFGPARRGQFRDRPAAGFASRGDRRRERVVEASMPRAARCSAGADNRRTRLDGFVDQPIAEAYRPIRAAFGGPPFCSSPASLCRGARLLAGAAHDWPDQGGSRTACAYRGRISTSRSRCGRATNWTPGARFNDMAEDLALSQDRSERSPPRTIPRRRNRAACGEKGHERCWSRRAFESP